MGVRVDTVDRDGGRVGVVTLDDPDRRNALSEEIVAGVVEAFDQLEADPSVGAVVVTGAPPAFCAGANLGNLGRSGESARAGGGDDSQRSGMLSIYEGFLRVGRSPLPTVAAVNGAAVGAGMNLALVCDLRVAARSARFDTRFLDLGLHPGGGHTWMLERAVGPQAAAAMVLFGQALNGEEAARRGLVWSCVDDDELMAEALGLAARAASGPPPLARRIKATLGLMGSVGDHQRAVDVELDAQMWSLAQPFFAERLAAIRARVQKKGS
ncbi:MAG TPA: enoyl-CoA hydratase [Acidimicrobiales bacterium]|nr:enoyl-CoA hydratase [Acidimicrobiales bacterium]